MFKVILLTFLVSFVWSTAKATYILSDKNDYRFLSDIKLNPYQTHLGVDFPSHDHKIFFPHITGHERGFIPQSVHPFHEISHSGGFRIPETHHGVLSHSNGFRPIHETKESFQSHSNGFRIPETRHDDLSHSSGFRPIPERKHTFLSHSEGFRIPETKHGHSNIQHKNGQNKHAHQNQKVSQQQIDIKSDNNGYKAHDNNNQEYPESFHLYAQNPFSGIINQGLIFGNHYFDKSGQSDKAKEITQNQEYDSGNRDNSQGQKIVNVHFQQISQSPEYDSDKKENSKAVIQQKIVNVEFEKPKSDSKINTQNYEAGSQKGNTDYKNEEQQKYHESPEYHQQKQNNNYNFQNHGFQHNGKIYPVIYASQTPLEQGGYLKFHEGNLEGYAEILGSYGSTGGPVYREIRLPDSFNYHSGLHHHGDGHHNSPILFNGNFQGNLNDNSDILIGVRNHLRDIGNPDLEYHLIGVNNSQSTGNNYPNYPEQKTDDSDSNYEQKPVMVELKSTQDEQKTYDSYEDSGSDYKEADIPKYSDSIKTDMPYKVEQKSVETGVKGQDNSYGSSGDNDNQYKDDKSSITPKYAETTKQLTYNLEQKSIDTGVKSVVGKKEDDYDGIGSVQKYPTTKSSAKDTQQKAVEIYFMMDGDTSDYKPLVDSAPEYPGIGSIDAPKYPDSKTSEPKLEQKSVETETYREIKATFKSTKPIPSTLGSKSDSDYTSGKINDIKKDIDSKNSGYETPVYVESKLGSNRNPGYSGASGGSSNSYFNAGHPHSRNNYNSRRDSPYTHHSGNSIRAPYSGNGYTSNFPTHRSSNFGRRNPGSYGSTVNYHRPTSGGTYGSTYQPPLNPTRPLVTGQNNKYPHQKSEYSGIGDIPSYPGVRSISSGSNIPKYHASTPDKSHKPTYSDYPNKYSDEKSVKVSYEYPRNSLKKDEPIYASSVKPSTDAKKPYSDTPTYSSGNYRPTSSGYPTSTSHSRPNKYGPASSSSYFKMDNYRPSSSIPSYPTSHAKDLNTYTGTDPKNGVGEIEYPGIGEKTSYSKDSDNKPAPYSPKISYSKTSDEKLAPYSPSKDTKLPMTEQKSYDNEDSSYSDLKSDSYKPSGEEYKGIGEIGSIPSGKSEIVGGRHPVKRPVKANTKTSTSGVKGKNEDKTEQKYLPITAVLSDDRNSDPKYDSKKYDQPSTKTKSSVKSKVPEKIEQKDLVYEALLAGEGPQSHATGSSGYGFDRSPAVNRPSTPYGSGHKDEHLPPMPYEFEFDIKDDEHGSEQYRKEKMDESGYLTGSYGFKDAEGIYRQVEYEASKEGFKVNKIRTNEPGTDNENPADVYFESHKQR